MGGYYKICEELGFKINISNRKIFFQEVDENKTIIIDSREQLFLKISKNYEIGALPYGDYSINGKIFLSASQFPILFLL